MPIISAETVNGESQGKLNYLLESFFRWRVVVLDSKLTVLPKYLRFLLCSVDLF